MLPKTPDRKTAPLHNPIANRFISAIQFRNAAVEIEVSSVGLEQGPFNDRFEFAALVLSNGVAGILVKFDHGPILKSSPRRTKSKTADASEQLNGGQHGRHGCASSAHFVRWSQCIHPRFSTKTDNNRRTIL